MLQGGEAGWYRTRMVKARIGLLALCTLFASVVRAVPVAPEDRNIDADATAPSGYAAPPFSLPIPDAAPFAPSAPHTTPSSCIRSPGDIQKYGRECSALCSSVGPKDVAALGCASLVCLGATGSGVEYENGRLGNALLLWTVTAVGGGLLGAWLGAEWSKGSTPEQQLESTLTGAAHKRDE